MEEIKGDKDKPAKGETLSISSDEVKANKETATKDEDNAAPPAGAPQTEVNDDSSFDKKDKLELKDEKIELVPKSEEAKSSVLNINSAIVPTEKEAALSPKEAPNAVAPAEEIGEPSTKDVSNRVAPAGKEAESSPKEAPSALAPAVEDEALSFKDKKSEVMPVELDVEPSPKDVKSEITPMKAAPVPPSKAVNNEIAPTEETVVSPSKDVKSEIATPPVAKEKEPSLKDEKNKVAPADNGEEDEAQYVYAVGRLCPKFPSQSERKEFEMAAAGLSPQISSTSLPFYDVLSKPDNFYLAKALSWVFEINGIAAYIVIPRDSTQLKTFISILEQPEDTSPGLDTLVGELWAGAPSTEALNNRALPIVRCNRMESFSFNTYTEYLADQTGAQSTAVKGLFENMLRLTDNCGRSGGHRAVNFIVFSYIDLYKILGKSLSTNSDTAQPSIFRGVTAKSKEADGRKKIEVAFKFEDSETTTEKLWSCEVDVTDQYPFMTVNLAAGDPKALENSGAVSAT